MAPAMNTARPPLDAYVTPMRLYAGNQAHVDALADWVRGFAAESRGVSRTSYQSDVRHCAAIRTRLGESGNSSNQRGPSLASSVEQRLCRLRCG
jgi:hypothetical protein